MSAINLGEIVYERPTHDRDAIHVAVALVEAGEQLRAGQHVEVNSGRAFASATPHGVVDPFLKGYVGSGEMFWLLLFPKGVVNMHHTWSHEDFPDEERRRVLEANYDSWCGESNC